MTERPVTGWAEFITARLDEERARAEAMRHDENPLDDYYSCAGGRTEPLGDLPWGEEHCDCHLAERKARVLRQAAAMREILAEHHPIPMLKIDAANCAQCGRLVRSPTVRHLASIWADHPDHPEAGR